MYKNGLSMGKRNTTVSYEYRGTDLAGAEGLEG